MRFTGILRALCLSLLVAHAACGAEPIRIVTPVGAGGPMDALARLLARQLADYFGEPVIVDNRPGADGVIATRFVMRSPPDGRTLLIGATTVAIHAATQTDFDPVRDLVPVVQLTSTQNLLTVNSSRAIQSVADLVRLAQSRPDGLNCGGVPGQMSLACEQFSLLLQGRIVTIPYTGVAPAVNALLAGHVDLMFAPQAAVRPLMAQGRLTALATLADTPSRPPLERLPMLKDTWPVMKMRTYSGIYVPAGTAPATVSRLNAELNKALTAQQVNAQLLDWGYAVVGGSPDILGRRVAEDVDYYRNLVRELKAHAASAPRQ